MLFAVLCCLWEKQGAEVKELPLVPSCKWKVGLRNRVCRPHKLIIITKIVARNVKHKSYLEEDYKEFLRSPTTVVYHNHLSLDQPWSTWRVCGVRTSLGLWEDKTVWREGRGDTTEPLCHPRLQPGARHAPLGSQHVQGKQPDCF